jgi:rhodanese-related sulfurtransferase
MLKKLCIAVLMSGSMVASAMAADVPASKRTVLGKYVTAKEAHDIARTEAGRALLIDVRTGTELMHVGVAESMTAHVPLAEIAQPIVWDDKAGGVRHAPNPTFVADIDAVVAKAGARKDSRILVICRSGQRSARAVDMLAAAGYTDVWSVTDGFEGDAAPDGRRTVNGWKNANLPWSYKIDKAKFYAGKLSAAP